MVDIQEEWKAFWADGNYGFDRLRAREKEARELEREARITPWQREEAERQKLAAAVWKMATADLRADKKDFYTGDMDAYHEGPCCSGCIGEMEEGYSGGGMYCCCYEGKTPLEQWGNPVEHPPVGNSLPDVFFKWGRRTQERYVKRFDDYLDVKVIFTDSGTISIPKEEPPKYTYKK